MITYEWVIETVDEHDDIQDVTHADTFAEAIRTAAAIRLDGNSVDVGLVRSRWNDSDENLEDRQWAYIEPDGKLPECFHRGAKVPAKFHREISAVNH